MWQIFNLYRLYNETNYFYLECEQSLNELLKKNLSGIENAFPVLNMSFVPHAHYL